MPRRFLLLTILAVLAAPAAADLAERKARLEAIRARAQSIQQHMAEARQQRSELVARLAELETRIGEIAGRVHALDQRIAELQERIDQLEARAARQQRQLDQRLAQLAEQIRAAYRVGRQGRLQMILSQNNPAQVGRLLGYYQYYARAQSQAIAGLRSDLKALRATREKLAAKRRRLKQKRAQRQELLASLKATQAQRRATLETIEDRLAERGARLESLRAQAQRLERLIDTLRQQRREDRESVPLPGPDVPFVQRKGQLVPPVSGEVIAAFGEPKAGGRLQWEGVWLAAPAGAPVVAAAPGRVVYIGWMHGYGLIVVLSHGNNYYTVYGHNQSITVDVGEMVRAGEQLAIAGKSGGHERSGVYFEIRHGREPIDPGAWLAS